MVEQATVKQVKILESEEEERDTRVRDCFFFQAEDGIRDGRVTGVQTCALPISSVPWTSASASTSAVARSAVTASSVSAGCGAVTPPGPAAEAEGASPSVAGPPRTVRSEERRVGKECRSRVMANE